MRTLNIILTIIFLGFGALQYNDDQSLLWMFIYDFVAFVCFLAIFERYTPVLTLTGSVALATYSLFFLPGVWEWLTQGSVGEIVGEMQADKPYVEAARNFFGLLIGAGVLIFQYRQGKKQFSPR